MEDLTKLLAALNEMRPITHKQTKTKLDIFSEKFVLILLAIAVILCAILLAFAGWHQYITPLSIFWRNMVDWMIAVTMLIPLISMLIQPVVGFIFLVRFKSESFRVLLLAIKHDKENVERLVRFNKTQLEEAREWIHLQSERLKRRIGLFVGNPEKIALVSLAGFGWSIWQDFSETIDTKLSFINSDSTQNLLIWGTAFLTGIAIGAVFLNILLRRYTYYVELIDLAIKRKSVITPLKN